MAVFDRDHLEDYARNIFSLMRAADDAAERNIVVEKVAEQGLGRAIMNRLNKAAAD